MKKSLLLLFGIVCSCLVWGQIFINTIDDLTVLATDIVAENGYVGQTIEIKADLTVSKIWTPIGTEAQPFQGTVKGNGHIISGLGAIKGTKGVGVFGYVGAQATIEDLGIGTGHIKTMKNDMCQYVGSLAGHNAGTINRCWNMATIEVNGTNVGGLVGWNEGEITDCYNAGPITKATDNIGGLAGTNKGKISYCYNIGFVRNGLGLVAKNEGGTITEGYYDRQLYIQSPDASHQDPEGVVAKDQTPEMFTIFKTRNSWTNSVDNYPILTKFKDHDAAQVSVASILVIVDSTELANHMNQLISDFKVNESNGVNWAKSSPIDESWIVKDSENPGIWKVNRPCRTTEVIMTACKNDHVREVIAIPMHIEDFLPGRWGGDSVMACLNEPLYLAKISLTDSIAPSGGKPEYKGKLILTRLTDNVDSTLIEKDSWEEYEGAYKNSSWTPTKPGYYVIKRYAADTQCHLEWEASEGEIPVFVPDSLKAGEIEARDNDSLCFDVNTTITINSVVDATCAGTKISYYWEVNGGEISGQEGASLTDFALPQPDKYTFKRYAYNDACEPKDKAKAAKNEYTVTLLAEFKEGKISSSKKSWSICDPTKVVEEVGTIEASAATGGDEQHITYQWYMNAAPIEGENAKKQDLTLSSVTLPAFVYGQTYIFYRMAKDGKCQTTPIPTDTVTITVYPEFKEGDIQPAIEDSLCWTANHTITVGSATAATFGGLTVHYYWTVNGVEISNSDSETLTYKLPDEVKEYTFRRFAYNEKCISKTDAIPTQTEYKVTLLAKFNPGSIPSDSIAACNVEDALAQLSTITGTDATGGSGKYDYSWEMYENGLLLQIPDEDGKDLDLTNYVTMNARYEFTRKAFDTKCNTEGQASEGIVIIEIYGEITPGQIESKTIDETCLVPGQEKEINVEIASLQPATTERGDKVYTWYMVKNGVRDIVGGNTESLSYTISLEGISNETEFTFYRTAYNSDCSSDEVRANGETKVMISFADTINKTVVLCESQFEDGKYVYSYPNQKEARISHTFYLDKIKTENTWTFRDPIEADCRPQVTIKVSVIPAPKIETENVAEVCQEGEDGTLPIYFQMKEGSANMYSIELSEGLRPYFDNKSHIEGTMPLVNAGEAGVITLHCKRIGFLGGEKIMYLQVGVESEEAGQSTCFCTPSEIRLTVTQGGYIENKYDKVLFIDNNPKKETDPKFTAYQWYKNGILVEGATGQYYHEGGATLVGSYFADLTYIENGKETIMRTCTLQMPVESGRKLGAPTTDVTKQLEDGHIIIQRAGAKYNIFGSKMSNL